MRILVLIVTCCLAYSSQLFIQGLWEYLVAGAVLSYFMSTAATMLELKKINSVFDWAITYVSIMIAGYFCGISLITIVSAGGLLRIMVSGMIGSNTVYFHPFKRVTIEYPLRFGISVALSALSIVTASAVYTKTMPHLALLILCVIVGILAQLYSSEIETLLYEIKDSFGLLTNNERTQKRLKVLLADISPLWTRQRASITLEELAKTSWLGADKQQEPEKVWEFAHPEITLFWKQDIVPSIISKDGRNVIGHILGYLDKYGDCPSVVMDSKNKGYQNDIGDKRTGRTSYDILRDVTLLEHSLNVAKEVYRNENTHMRSGLEKLVIAGLAHDLGKVVGHNNIKTYVTGDHPQNSVYILLNDIEGFGNLKYAKEVSQLVMNHHSMTGDNNILAKTFQSMDANARRYEIGQYVAKQKQLEQAKEPSAVLTTHPTPPPQAQQPLVAPIMQPATTATISAPILPPMPPIVAQTDEANNIPVSIPNFAPAASSNSIKTTNLMYRDLEQQSGRPDFVDIPWFDMDKFIIEINSRINKVERGWYTALTVNGNMVLVLTSAAWKMIQIQARRANVDSVADIPDSDMNNDTKKSVLLSVTEVLRNNGVLDERWIKKGYFNGKFELTDKADNMIESGWYIPLTYATFEKFNTYDDYEQKKQGDLKDITNARVPKKN